MIKFSDKKIIDVTTGISLITLNNINVKKTDIIFIQIKVEDEQFQNDLKTIFPDIETKEDEIDFSLFNYWKNINFEIKHLKNSRKLELLKNNNTIYPFIKEYIFQMTEDFGNLDQNFLIDIDINLEFLTNFRIEINCLVVDYIENYQEFYLNILTIV